MTEAYSDPNWIRNYEKKIRRKRILTILKWIIILIPLSLIGWGAENKPIGILYGCYMDIGLLVLLGCVNMFENG